MACGNRGVPSKGWEKFVMCIKYIYVGNIFGRGGGLGPPNHFFTHPAHPLVPCFCCTSRFQGIRNAIQRITRATPMGAPDPAPSLLPHVPSPNPRLYSWATLWFLQGAWRVQPLSPGGYSGTYALHLGHPVIPARPLAHVDPPAGPPSARPRVARHSLCLQAPLH